MEGEGLLLKQHDAFAYCIQCFLCCIYFYFLIFLSYANIKYTFSAFLFLLVERFVTFIEGFQKSSQLLFMWKVAVWSGDN